jgi:hypothetical protein
MGVFSCMENCIILESNCPGSCTLLHMAGGRLLLTADPARIQQRDMKLLAREEALADAQGLVARKYICRICIDSIRSCQRRSVIRKHLQEIGRHLYYCGHTQIRFVRCFLCSLSRVYIKGVLRFAAHDKCFPCSILRPLELCPGKINLVYIGISHSIEIGACRDYL